MQMNTTATSYDLTSRLVNMDIDHKSLRGRLTFRIEQNDNGTFVASIVHQNDGKEADAVGALYYVVVVILIYACSILLMITSYIRKNNVDRKLNRYLKEMANVRKREQQLQLYNAAAKAAAQTRKSLSTTDNPDPAGEEAKWSGAAHWSEIRKDYLECEYDRSRSKSNPSTSSTGEETSGRHGDASDVEQPFLSQKVNRRTDTAPFQDCDIKKASVKIIFEAADADSENDAFLTDDQEDTSHDHHAQPCMSRDHAQPCMSRDHAQPCTFSMRDEATSGEDDNDDGCKELLLDPDDSEVPVDDSESDQFNDKPEGSDKFHWTDFQVVSSV